MKTKADEKLGLSTFDALGVLYNELDKLLQEDRPKCSTYWATVKDILNPMNEHSTFSWISCAFILLSASALIFSSTYVESSLYGNLALQGFFVIIIGVFNAFLVAWDNCLRKGEVPSRILALLPFIRECQEKCIWRVDNYPHLCSPYSPCITLQWTYRDGRLVNLPWALLVKGDTILLRPGQPAPGNCFPQDTSGTPLSCGEVYTPPQKHDHLTVPVARVPFSNRRYVLQETPLLKNVREVLECSTKNNLTCFDKLRHLVLTESIQNMALPLLMVCTVLVNTLRYVYVGQWVGSAHWSVMFLLIPASVSLPLLPLLFPGAWLVLNTFGNAKISAFLQSSASKKVRITCGLQSTDPFEDISIDQGVEDIDAGVKWGQHFFHALLGKQHSLALTRSANPLHILGSVTALCCVDKKGILSWPNPTAEKVFFLRTSTGKSTLPSGSNIVEQAEMPLDATDTAINEEVQEEAVDGAESVLKTNEPDPPQTVVEVLDLTHNLSCPFRLHFDDTSWKEHIGSLKPIGLAILLNTCNMATQEHYIQFCSHVTCEALYNEDLVPVTNRRCLCELSKQIGFNENIKQSYALKEQLSTFRHVQPETVRRDIKFARSLALATKLKLPFPHMVAVVTSEVTVPNSLQLFSQATGDIALDSCVDFWDGTTLRPLTNSDRKKILDFYQRTSLTAYCTAFAYRPLGRGLSSTLSRIYLELPADSHYLYFRNRSPTPLDWQTPILSQSTDSVLAAGDAVDEEVTDIEGCFEMQCNQIFLGMVTMQYQAQIEMVQLIEQLERACIRFVHFSKENELRSRVFSEKMGLESGWNCHISLLSSSGPVDPPLEQEELEIDDEPAPESPLLATNLVCGSLEGSRTMSVSAPCAINFEATKETNENQRLEEDMELSSQHEVWQSLSCLTDSTEQSAHINFDMSNRAKLPRGIDQIRPHLEKVDNVPLLVSLFTDCTPSTTQQMIGIMQDYGEIVCVLGSSANADNSSIFLKANASVSVEPLYPQVCQKVPVYMTMTESVSPVQLSQRLNSLPCSVSISRQRPVSLYQLIMHARHYMQCLWNCIQFWVCSMLTLSILQVISTIVMLPPIVTSGQVLWLSCIIVPLLSLSLVHSPTNPQVMQRPMPKNPTTLNAEMAIFALWCYGLKFLPILLIVPLVYTSTLANHCLGMVKQELNGTCNLIYPESLKSEIWGGWGTNTVPLSNAQTFAASLVVIHLVAVSVSFVHRECLSWLRSPFRNKVWAFTSLFLLMTQCGHSIVSLKSNGKEIFRYGIPWMGLSVAAVSPFFIFLVNEVVKWQEIKANIRYEKRARLDFGTKLGMNSPF